jgi:hypothetical protein
VPELRRRRRRFADEQRLTHDWEIKDFAGEVVPPLGLRMSTSVNPTVRVPVTGSTRLRSATKRLTN